MAQKPRLFIGSSREAIPYTHAIHARLGRVAEVTPWHAGVFQAGNYTMEDLEEQVRSSDFAVFVFSPDDISTIRGTSYFTVRDNTILETGMFISKLGRQRVFFITPNEIPTQDGADEQIMGQRIPSDFFGIAGLSYEIRTDENLEAGVSVACAAIEARIVKLGRWEHAALSALAEAHAVEVKRIHEESSLEKRDITSRYRVESQRIRKIVRLFRDLLKSTPITDPMLQKLSDTLRTVYTSYPYDVKGVAIYRVDEQGEYIRQIAGNVGDMGREYTLRVNDEKDARDPNRIHVVDAHKQNTIKIALHKASMEKEYLLCYPVAKRFVFTIHILADEEIPDIFFNENSQENQQLLATLHDLLGGEI